MHASNRVLVIGLDGATWDVLDPWIRDGTLPNLGRMRAGGSWGPLNSSIPPITAAAWSNFMTGKRPSKHGVYHFVKLFDDHVTQDGSPELVNARSIKSPAVWDVMGRHDRRVVLINIPLTYPPRPVNGVMITGLLTPGSAPVFTYPPELSKELSDYQIDLARFIDKTPHVDAFGADITAPTLRLLEEFRDMEEKRARVSLSLLDSEPWEFFMVVFTGTDRMGHYFWPYHRSPSEDDSPEVRRLCEGVRDFYRRLDDVVGEMARRAGEDATLIILSDHGMGPTYHKRMHCNYWLQQQGWLTATSNGGRAMNIDGWLGRLGLPRDRIGRIVYRIPGLAKSSAVKKAANSRSSSVDANRSRAVAVPIFFNIMGIRIGLEGPEKEALRREIVRRLQEIVDPETGRQVVQRAFPAEEYYTGPHTENLPDIIAILDPAYGCSYHLSRYSSIITDRPLSSGPAMHRMAGIFIARGPGISARAEPLPALTIEDVAPTILHCMGLPVPSDMDGRVLAELWDPAVLAARPVTHEEPSGYWPVQAEVAFGDETMTPEDEQELRDRLRALGYFE